MAEVKIPIVFEPGSTVSNKTGLWRSMVPHVNKETCTGCMRCADLCPDSSISIIDKKAVIDLMFCKGCGICANECATKSIVMKFVGED